MTIKSVKYDIGRKVLSIGPNYKRPKGGIAQLLYVYSKYFDTFNFIATVNGGSKISKVCTLIKAYLIFLYYMLFKGIRIVHVHGASYNSMKRKRLFISTAKFFSKKVVYHVHGGALKEWDKTNHEFINCTFSKCDVVIALTNDWKDFITSTYHCKCVVVENIVDNPQQKVITHKVDNHTTFLYLGLISPLKGIYDLIDVIVSNHSQFDGVAKFVIGGNGETEKLLSLIKCHHIEDVVEFVGWVSGKEKEELLNNCDVFVLPSYVEGQPISILEALSYGKPIVSTPVGGIPDIVKHGYNGLLFTPGNKTELAKCFNTVMRMSAAERKQWGNHSLEIIAPHLPSSVIAKINHIYNELL